MLFPEHKIVGKVVSFVYENNDGTRQERRGTIVEAGVNNKTGIPFLKLEVADNQFRTFTSARIVGKITILHDAYVSTNAIVKELERLTNAK